MSEGDIYREFTRLIAEAEAREEEARLDIEMKIKLFDIRQFNPLERTRYTLVRHAARGGGPVSFVMRIVRPVSLMYFKDVVGRNKHIVMMDGDKDYLIIQFEGRPYIVPTPIVGSYLNEEQIIGVQNYCGKLLAEDLELLLEQTNED